jgi:hypothetical protein
MLLVDTVKWSNTFTCVLHEALSFPGVKWPGREADHSPPSSVEVNECVELYLHFSNTSSWLGAPFKIKHRDNFTFCLLKVKKYSVCLTKYHAMKTYV